MYSALSSLDNRELSTIIWFVILIIWVSKDAKVRNSIKEFIKASLKRYIIISFIFLFAYTLVSTWLLSHIGLWDISQIKNTIFWFFLVAAASFLELSNIANNDEYFKTSIKDNLKIIVVIEFILNFYTFSFIAELIFVPFLVIIGVTLAVSQNKEKNKAVAKFLNYITNLVAVFIIIFTIYKLITEFNEIAKKQTLIDFIVPTILSILLLPYIYIQYVYINYDKIFFRLKFLIKDKILFVYTMKQAIICFHLKIIQLKRWVNALHYQNINSKSDIDRSIEEIYKRISEAKSPPIVPEELGWSPYKATDFLKSEGLKTNFYKKSFDNIWFADSSCLDVDDELILSSVVFCLEGDSVAVKFLKLEMNIFNKEKLEAPHQLLLKIASQLFEQAIGSNISAQVSSAIIKGGNIQEIIKSKLVKVVTKNLNSNVYMIIFSIEII
ncbi:hypothetical protein HY745_12795 [Candidatus Desantisbacteria bacterium]|nr:hypothetical protein [Candidatus Desantisbacteria bacterium]